MMPNKPVAVAIPNCDNCEKADGVRPLTWAQALAEFRQSMETWLAAGRPLVSAQQHSARLTVCRKCPGGHFKHFQCKLCKCVVAIKAKLPTETCPANYWPRS